MGQQPSVPDQQPRKRLAELNAMDRQAVELLDRLRKPAADEEAAGVPATRGSAQAAYDAALRQWRRVTAEQTAIWQHMRE